MASEALGNTPPLPPRTRPPTGQIGQHTLGVSNTNSSLPPPQSHSAARDFHSTHFNVLPAGGNAQQANMTQHGYHQHLPVPPLPSRSQTGQSRGQSVSAPGYGGVSGHGYSSIPSNYQMAKYPYQYTTSNRFNSGSGNLSDLAQLAEHSVIPAFQSIESIVSTFTSVSTMLESSYHAVRASFQAIIGVAEQLSRMKIHLSQVFSALASFRVLKYLHQKLTYLLGKSKLNPELGDFMWRSAGSQSLTESDLKDPIRWPVWLYLGLTLAAPYLVWKLIATLHRKSAKVEWERGIGEHFIAKSVHPFNAQAEGDLSFGPDEMLVLAPRSLQPRMPGWLLASSRGRTGLVPANYIKIISRREGAPINNSNSAEQSKPSTCTSEPPPDILGGNATAVSHSDDFERYFRSAGGQGTT